MIYITGDCHGDFTKLDKYSFKNQEYMTKDDIVIICGDFGGVFRRDSDFDIVYENIELDILNKRNFTTCFCDGNHENFDRLYNEFPVKEFHGGLVHEIRSNIFHLIRGEVYEIDGKKILAFGGAKSQDVSDGILDQSDDNYREKLKYLLDNNKRHFRIKGIGWWEEEMPSEKEMRNCRKNLIKHNNEVDFIITHCAPTSTVAIMSSGAFKSDQLTDFLEEIRQTTKYDKWFFGHYHSDKYINDKEVLVYNKIIRVS